MTHPKGSLDPLETLLDRLIPSDKSVGANELRLGEEVRRRLPDVDRLLGQINFGGLSPTEQEALLLNLERNGDPTFEALVSVAHELYYSNPASWHSCLNFSNLSARSNPRSQAIFRRQTGHSHKGLWSDSIL